MKRTTSTEHLISANLVTPANKVNRIARESSLSWAGVQFSQRRIDSRLRGNDAIQGFSIVELLVVMVILGLLMGLVGPRLFGKVDSSKVKTAEAQVKMLKTSLQTYRLDLGSYPSTDQGLQALMRRPQSGANLDFWQGPYLDDALPVDPWNNPYQYRLEPTETQDFVLFSMGADGQEGGEGLNKDVGYLPL